jgi:hypothetical protein
MSYGASSYGQTSYGEGLQDAEEPQAPQGTIAAFTSVNRDEDLVNVFFSYSLADADGFEYRVDGGSAVDIETASSFQVTGLTVDTVYPSGYIQIRAYNEIDPGDWFDVPSFNTNERVASDGQPLVRSVVRSVVHSVALPVIAAGAAEKPE